MSNQSPIILLTILFVLLVLAFARDIVDACMCMGGMLVDNVQDFLRWVFGSKDKTLPMDKTVSMDKEAKVDSMGEVI